MKRHLKIMLPISNERDIPEINSWYAARDLAPPLEYTLPPDGFIVQGIGAGFLILTNSGFGILEHFISNPEAPSTDRHLVMDMIAGALINLGHAMGMKTFIAITKHPAIEKLCAKYELKELQGMKVFGRVI